MGSVMSWPTRPIVTSTEVVSFDFVAPTVTANFVLFWFLIFDFLWNGKVVDDGKFCRRRRWVRTPVDLNDHVFIRILGSKIENPDQFVEDYISHLTTTPLDLSKPLWELHLLNLKTSDSESLGIFRIHHSVGDGASLMSLLLACTRRTSDPDALPTLPAPAKRLPPPPPPPDSGDFSVRFLRFLTAIWSVITLIWNTFVDVTVFAATILFLSDSKTPIKGPPAVERSTKRFVHRSISLGDIKFVKNAMNTVRILFCVCVCVDFDDLMGRLKFLMCYFGWFNQTINDVLLGVTQAGLSRYLNRRYGEFLIENCFVCICYWRLIWLLLV